MMKKIKKKNLISAAHLLSVQSGELVLEGLQGAEAVRRDKVEQVEELVYFWVHIGIDHTACKQIDRKEKRAESYCSEELR